MRPWSIIALVAAQLATAGGAWADARGSRLPGGEVVFNQVLPAGKEVVISLPVPGADEVTGTVEIWPADDCRPGPRPHGDQQYRRLGLAVIGSNAERVVSATVPPLQIQTSYCIQFELQRGLSDDQVNALAEGVGDRAYNRFDWATACADATVEDQVAAMIEQELTERLRRVVADDTAARTAAAGGIAQPDARVESAEVHAAARLAAALSDVRGLCVSVNRNDQALSESRRASVAADAALGLAKRRLQGEGALRPAVLAWPPAVRESAAPFTTGPLAEALEGGAPTLTVIAGHLDPIDAPLARELKQLATLADPALAAPLKALQGRLQKPPATARELVLFLPSQRRFVAGAELLDPRVYAGMITDLVATPELMIGQLRLVDRQSPKNGEVVKRWLDAIADVLAANRDLVAIQAEMVILEKAREEQVTKIKGDMIASVKKDTVRRLLRQTTRASSRPRTGNPATTDENASWISATVGVAVAVPYLDDGDVSGFAEPWLVPYAGANIYFRRVDRVIDPGDLVGPRFFQRNSLTVGLWLKKPSLRGSPISGVWESGPVPFVGVGHRFTPYIRVDGGVAVFQHARRLPTVTDKAYGGAVWLGVSIDADLWAAVSGKLGK